MTFLTVFTLFHTVISIVGILAGFVVIAAMLGSRHSPRWVAIFLTTTAATSITGFFFPVQKLMPSHIVGIISLLILAPAIYGLYSRKLAGGWRKTYVIGSVAAQYFNFFVLIAQSFAKIPALHAFAPTQKEPPFAIAQLIALVAFLTLGFLAVKRFKKDQPTLLLQPIQG